jgi:acetoacetyl-CoA synthetase
MSRLILELPEPCASLSGMWHEGDFARRTDNGGFVITGRSDATLNPGRIRIGSGEIYQVLQRVPDVVDSLVIAQ